MTAKSKYPFLSWQGIKMKVSGSYEWGAEGLLQEREENEDYIYHNIEINFLFLSSCTVQNCCQFRPGQVMTA